MYLSIKPKSKRSLETETIDVSVEESSKQFCEDDDEIDLRPENEYEDVDLKSLDPED